MKTRIFILGLVVAIVAIIAISATTALGGGIVNQGAVCNQGAVALLKNNPNAKPVYEAACEDDNPPAQLPAI